MWKQLTDDRTKTFWPFWFFLFLNFWNLNGKTRSKLLFLEPICDFFCEFLNVKTRSTRPKPPPILETQIQNFILARAAHEPPRHTLTLGIVGRANVKQLPGAHLTKTLCPLRKNIFPKFGNLRIFFWPKMLKFVPGWTENAPKCFKKIPQLGQNRSQTLLPPVWAPEILKIWLSFGPNSGQPPPICRPRWHLKSWKSAKFGLKLWPNPTPTNLGPVTPQILCKFWAKSGPASHSNLQARMAPKIVKICQIWIKIRAKPHLQ